MPDTIRKVSYFKIRVPNKSGEGARILRALRDAGVNLIAFSGFPRGGKAQLNLIPESPNRFKEVAKKAGFKLSSEKSCFAIQGEDRVGALAEIHSKLAEAKINVVSLDGVSAGEGRYGAILWVKPQVAAKTGKVLGVS